MAASRAGNPALWLAVAYVVHDCVCSVFLPDKVEHIETAAAQAGRDNSSGNSGGGGGGASAAALFVDKASLRFFKFTRGDMVIMK